MDGIDGIALITDSSACIPPSILAGLDVGIVPIMVQVGSEEYRSGIDLEPRRLYRAIERGEPVKSVAPSPLDYLDAIEAAGDRPAVIVTPGHGLVVLAAAEMRNGGGSHDDVVAAAEDAAARAELVACLETLDYLRQSGRVPALALGLANHLGVRPVFRLRQGTAERLGLPRSERAALARIAREWRSGAGPAGGRFAVFHAARPERAEELSRALGGASFVTEFGAAMAIHTGPGVVGVAWLRPPAGEADL